MRARRAEWGKSHVHSHTHILTQRASRAPSTPTQKTRHASASLYLLPSSRALYGAVRSRRVSRRVLLRSLARERLVSGRAPRVRGCRPNVRAEAAALLCQGLQPYVPEVAALRAMGCIPTRHRQPYVRRAPGSPRVPEARRGRRLSAGTPRRHPSDQLAVRLIDQPPRICRPRRGGGRPASPRRASPRG
eukprot:scaffold37999_cov60-Phaeocystis_antarctica.AAC.9